MPSTIWSKLMEKLSVCLRNILEATNMSYLHGKPLKLKPKLKLARLREEKEKPFHIQ